MREYKVRNPKNTVGKKFSSKSNKDAKDRKKINKKKKTIRKVHKKKNHGYQYEKRNI